MATIVLCINGKRSYYYGLQPWCIHQAKQALRRAVKMGDTHTLYSFLTEIYIGIFFNL